MAAASPGLAAEAQGVIQRESGEGFAHSVTGIGTAEGVRVNPEFSDMRRNWRLVGRESDSAWTGVTRAYRSTGVPGFWAHPGILRPGENRYDLASGTKVLDSRDPATLRFRKESRVSTSSIVYYSGTGHTALFAQCRRKRGAWHRRYRRAAVVRR